MCSENVLLVSQGWYLKVKVLKKKVKFKTQKKPAVDGRDNSFLISIVQQYFGEMNFTQHTQYC